MMNRSRGTVHAPWLIVARREIMVQLTDKAFWIGTLTTLALVILSFTFSGFMNAGSSAVGVATDEAEAVVTHAQAEGVGVEPIRLAADELRSAVEDGTVPAALTYADADGWTLLVKDIADSPALHDSVRMHQIEANAAAAGVDPSTIMSGTALSTVTVGPAADDGPAITIATLAFAVLFMLSALTYGMQIASSVVTEKESRVIEILAAAIPTRHLLIGKVVGNSLMALGQVILIISVALIGLSNSELRPLLGVIAPIAGWFVVFFLIGFASLACLWAAAGAMATRVQDLSQTTTPLTMIILLVYFVGFLARGEVAAVLSYVPIASTVLMPGRLLSGEATWVDALLALIVAVLFMMVAVWFGGRIYRRGLLQTGGVLKLREALRTQ